MESNENTPRRDESWRLLVRDMFDVDEVQIERVLQECRRRRAAEDDPVRAALLTPDLVAIEMGVLTQEQVRHLGERLTDDEDDATMEMTASAPPVTSEDEDAAADTLQDTAAPPSAAPRQGDESDTLEDTGPMFMAEGDLYSAETLPQTPVPPGDKVHEDEDENQMTGPLLLPGQEQQTMNLVPDEAPTMFGAETEDESDEGTEPKTGSVTESDRRKLRRVKFGYRFLVGLTVTLAVACAAAGVLLYIPAANAHVVSLLGRVNGSAQTSKSEMRPDEPLQPVLISVAQPTRLVVQEALKVTGEEAAVALSVPPLEIKVPDVDDTSWMKTVNIEPEKPAVPSQPIVLPLDYALFDAKSVSFAASYTSYRVDRLLGALRTELARLEEVLKAEEPEQQVLLKRGLSAAASLAALDALFVDFPPVRQVSREDPVLRLIDSSASAVERSKRVAEAVAEARKSGQLSAEEAKGVTGARAAALSPVTTAAATALATEWRAVENRLCALLPKSADGLPAFATAFEKARPSLENAMKTAARHGELMQDLPVHKPVSDRLEKARLQAQQMLRTVSLLQTMAPCVVQVQAIRRQRDKGQETSQETLRECRKLVDASQKMVATIDDDNCSALARKAVAMLDEELTATIEEYTQGVPSEVTDAIALCEKWAREPWHPTASFDEVLTGFVDPPLECRLARDKVKRVLENKDYARYRRLLSKPSEQFEKRLKARTAEWQRVREHLRRLPRLQFRPADWNEWLKGLNKLWADEDYWGGKDVDKAAEGLVAKQGLVLALTDYFAPVRAEALKVLKDPPDGARRIVPQVWYWGNVAGALDKLPEPVRRRLQSHKMKDGKPFLAPVNAAIDLVTRKTVRIWGSRMQQDEKVRERLLRQLTQYRDELAHFGLETLLAETRDLNHEYVGAPWFKNDEKKWWSWQLNFTCTAGSESACEELAARLCQAGVPVNRLRIKRADGRAECAVIAGFWREEAPAQKAKQEVQKVLRDAGARVGELTVEESSPDF